MARARLGAARGVVWFGFHVAWAGTVVLLRPDHPFRVYLNGARTTVLKVHLESLRHTRGPRIDRKMERGLGVVIAAAGLSSLINTQL